MNVYTFSLYLLKSLDCEPVVVGLRVGTAPPQLPPQNSMFCALSQNNRHLEKLQMHLNSKLIKELKNEIEVLIGRVVLKYGSKQSKCIFGSITHKNRKAYLNFNAFFEFLG